MFRVQCLGLRLLRLKASFFFGDFARLLHLRFGATAGYSRKMLQSSTCVKSGPRMFGVQPDRSR